MREKRLHVTTNEWGKLEDRRHSVYSAMKVISRLQFEMLCVGEGFENHEYRKEEWETGSFSSPTKRSDEIESWVKDFR